MLAVLFGLYAVIGGDGKVENTIVADEAFRLAHPEMTMVEFDGEKVKTKNAPDKGDTYDPVRKGFLKPKPADKASYVFNEETLLWEPPTERPKDGKEYVWDEEKQKWQEKVK